MPIVAGIATTRGARRLAYHRARLTDGCEQGTFVLRLSRPDGSLRTWWRARPDETAMNDPAMELVVPQAAELREIPHHLLALGQLPDLWPGNRISVQSVYDYFAGGNVVKVSRNGYFEPVAVPKAATEVVDSAIKAAVESGFLWLLNGPSSILAEAVPLGVLAPSATLQSPPPQIGAAEILSQTLPAAWESDRATGLSIATALSQKFGQTLPWKTVRDVIDNALRARFTELDPTSGSWPCEFSSAATIRLKPSAGGKAAVGGTGAAATRKPNSLVAEAELTPSEIQDFGDIVQKILEIKAKHNFALKFRLQIEIDGGSSAPSVEAMRQLNQLLRNIRDELEMK